MQVIVGACVCMLLGLVCFFFSFLVMYNEEHATGFHSARVFFFLARDGLTAATSRRRSDSSQNPAGLSPLI